MSFHGKEPGDSPGRGQVFTAFTDQSGFACTSGGITSVWAAMRHARRQPGRSFTWVLLLQLVMGALGSSIFAGEAPTSPPGQTSPFRIRGTLPWHNFLSGPTAWTEQVYRAYLDEMARHGLNLIAFHCYAGGAERYAPYVEPMIRLHYRDVVPEAGWDTSLTARWGYRPLAIQDFVFGTRDRELEHFLQHPTSE